RASHPVPVLAVLVGLFGLISPVQTSEALPGTQPLTWDGDLSARMVEGIDKFLMRETERSVEERRNFWRRDFSSREAYEKSVQPNRKDFQKIIGAMDPRLPVKALQYVSSTATLSIVATTESYRIYAVSWPLFDDVSGEGLLLQPA